MDSDSSKEKLQVGRAVFAKTLGARWIAEHSKMLITATGTVVCLLVCLIQFVPRLVPTSSPTSWIAQTSGDSSLSEPAGELQRLLAAGNALQAERYAKAALKRTRDLTSSYYTRFSQNTLAITHAHYEAALNEAKQLKQDLEQDSQFWASHDRTNRSGTVLYAYNLLRIASLQQAIGSVEGELAAWDELLDNSGWQSQPKNRHIYDQEAYSLLASNFQKGQTSLLDFIQARKALLTEQLVAGKEPATSSNE